MRDVTNHEERNWCSKGKAPDPAAAPYRIYPHATQFLYDTDFHISRLNHKLITKRLGPRTRRRMAETHHIDVHDCVFTTV